MVASQARGDGKVGSPSTSSAPYRPSQVDTSTWSPIGTSTVQAVVASHLAAAALVAQTDAITVTMSSFAHAIARLLEVREREVPVHLPQASIAHAWHPRFDSDPAHVYVRRRILAIAQRLGSG